jgi:hypothetical protein
VGAELPAAAAVVISCCTYSSFHGCQAAAAAAAAVCLGMQPAAVASLLQGPAGGLTLERLPAVILLLGDLLLLVYPSAAGTFPL